MNIEDKKSFIKFWAESLGCALVVKGEVGFGRNCVGIIEPNIGHYVDINPYSTMGDYEDWHYIFDEVDSLYPNYDTVPNAYHKHSCLSVLVIEDDYDEAINQLYTWVTDIVSKGAVEVVKHSVADKSKMTDIELLFTPEYKVALVYKEIG
jgi:hypothetical protein